MMSQGMPRSRRRDDDLSADIRLLLEAIEKERIPDRLLDLATRLQTALNERRFRGSCGDKT